MGGTRVAGLGAWGVRVAGARRKVGQRASPGERCTPRRRVEQTVEAGGSQPFPWETKTAIFPSNKSHSDPLHSSASF